MLKTLRITQGDRAYYDLAVTLDGEVVDVSDWPLWFTVKRLPADLDAAAIFQKSTDNAGIAIGETGVPRITVAPADTTDAAPGRYYYDVQGRDLSGAPHTLERGIFVIDPQITLAT